MENLTVDELVESENYVNKLSQEVYEKIIEKLFEGEDCVSCP